MTQYVPLDAVAKSHYVDALLRRLGMPIPGPAERKAVRRSQAATEKDRR